MEFLLPIFVQTVVPVLGTALSALATWGMHEVRKYVKQKTKIEAVNDAVEHITHTTETVIKRLDQTLVADLKAEAADGKMSKDVLVKALKGVKEQAVAEVMNQVPATILKTAELAVNSVNQLICDKIEKIKLENKMLEPVIAAGVVEATK